MFTSTLFVVKYPSEFEAFCTTHEIISNKEDYETFWIEQHSFDEFVFPQRCLQEGGWRNLTTGVVVASHDDIDESYDWEWEQPLEYNVIPSLRAQMEPGEFTVVTVTGPGRFSMIAVHQDGREKWIESEQLEDEIIQEWTVKKEA